MGKKSKPKPKCYRCLIWLQMPAGESLEVEAIAAEIETALVQADITVHEHVDQHLGQNTGDYYGMARIEGMGVSPIKIQELIAHLGTPLVLLQVSKGVAS